MKKNKIIVCVIVLFTISFLSIGFSAFNASIFIEDIGATVRLNSDIRITDITISDATEEVIANYIDYDVGSIFSEIYLPNDDSSITYKVSITNFESTEMGIFDITGLPDNLEYSISDYVLKDKICNEEGKCNLGITKDIYITIKYKNNIKDSDTNLYKIKLLFDFRNYHTINYENVYGFDFPTEVIHGDSLKLNLDYEDINLSLKNAAGYIYVANTDYEYKDNIVTINEVNEDLYIEVKDKIVITNINSNGDINENQNIKYFGNRLNSSITLSNSASSQQTLNITLYNSTNYNYAFSDVSFEKYDNNNITYSLSGLKKGDIITKGSSIQISLIFKYIDNVNFDIENFNNTLNSFLKFNFEYVTTPVLLNNMVPVTYSNNSWSKISSTSQNWHNYINGKWANAITYNHNLAYNQVTNNAELKQFNGTSDDYVSLGSANYDFGNNITVVVRFKIYEYGTEIQGLIGNVESAGFYLGITTAGQIRFRFYESADVNKNLYSKEAVKLDTWYTIVLTYDGNVMKLYSNGVLEDSLEYTNNIGISAAPIVIGGNPNASGITTSGFFKGAISEAIIMKEPLSEEEIIKNYGKFLNHIPTAHKVLYYLKFDAGNGIVCNGAQYAEDGMLFDGVDDYISVGYSSYDFNNNFSIGARLKISAYSDGEYTIFGNPQSAGFNIFKRSDNKFRIAVYDLNTSSYINLYTSFIPELNTWYTLMATYDGSKLRLYVDGEEHTSLAVDIEMKVCTTPFMIGVNANLNSKLGGSYINGMISDVILVDEALSSEQIQQYYYSDLRTIISDKTLISYDLREYESRENGTIIPEEMINGMWVWIPRFNAITPTGTGVINVTTVSPEQKAHDAFNFSDKELEGFWIGKFENGANAIGENTNSNILIKPNTNSLVNVTIGNAFTQINNIISLGGIYGFDSTSNKFVNTHLIKNNEWGAVAYFAQSKYGLCKAGTCAQLEANSTTITGGNDYVANIGQSTTQNVYGVYDLNGGASEFVMGNYNNTLNSSDGFSALPDLNYFNVYTTETDYLSNDFQHALFETNGIFNNTTSNFVNSSNVWLKRSNLFSYNNSTGVNSSTDGSRSVLIVK